MQRSVIRGACVLISVLAGVCWGSGADAACVLPNQISNGQVADATKVMGDLTALKSCVDTVVSSIPATFGPFATGTDASQLTGTISVNRFDSGLSADTSHFLRGDGKWAIPPSGGAGTTFPTPTVRASNIQAFTTSSITVSWPAGTVAGDLVVVFAGDGYAIQTPPGWSEFNNTGINDWANGLTTAKIMTASDISAGGVTINLQGAYNGVAIAVALDGSTVHGVRDLLALRSTGNQSYANATPSGLFKAVGSDLMLGFTYVRGTMNTSISNFTQLQATNSANASAFLGRYSLALNKIGVSETATYPVGNNGYYWSLLAIF